MNQSNTHPRATVAPVPSWIRRDHEQDLTRCEHGSRYLIGMVLYITWPLLGQPINRDGLRHTLKRDIPTAFGVANVLIDDDDLTMCGEEIRVVVHHDPVFLCRRPRGGRAGKAQEAYSTTWRTARLAIA